MLDRFVKRNMNNLFIHDSQHNALLIIHQSIDSGSTQLTGQNPVELRRRTASLHMSQYRHPDVILGMFLSHLFSNAVSPT